MTKSEIRIKYKKWRSELTSKTIEDSSLSIANQALLLPIWNFSFYHIFLSIKEKNEVNTEYLLHILNGKDKNCVLSKSNFKDLTMKHYLLTDNTIIKKNSCNIPEPVDGIVVPTEKIQVVFIPLLAFDVVGNRLGYGKGFYDRFLLECKKEVVKIGVSLFEAEENLMPHDPFDIRMDFCITPEKIYRF
ncbi:MAG: 5-formyltetrahydrofolate cyclo-ligase [Bacteroidetes bacterium HGW-Bacteroidetes-2]|jgi:5-formyltetrahydrofolate cyclo-ligase|nr:MAG: 5-formyltetrahydrofolate cyclo-ligase [Bacteroidetes bacterium HGW-Bacteroidetes-2]